MSNVEDNFSQIMEAITDPNVKSAHIGTWIMEKDDNGGYYSGSDRTGLEYHTSASGFKTIIWKEDFYARSLFKEKSMDLKFSPSLNTIPTFSEETEDNPKIREDDEKRKSEKDGQQKDYYNPYDELD